ncbi:non-ribosomal peptide synthetase/type I polyketide synthase [Pararhizobium mangrovi]|uniref:Amino acid adenylation domain-containing protein n=1 Tax=Pararhizobium mangrovi TaxID=2590452 RepID=A0A506U0R1_9HYPH|nr:non-ribosomal peptide synthetase/type I polyketide synthase [Pararhizobium mangrovi]TPW27932.1 amino acid adenylation domain-containing protein [Pararhizobium mangrovi]
MTDLRDFPNAIAIVGMGARLPGADNLDAFWDNLLAGRESIARFTDDELEDAFPPEIRNRENFVRARPILENVDLFDAGFFGMYPREAALTDPQQRVFLECAWEAIEQAGYDPREWPGLIGVFAGSSMPTYLMRNVLSDRSAVEGFGSEYQVGCYPELLGSSQDFLATRVSYRLNLRGPSMTLQTACSTSLTAVTLATQALLLHQCDMALAGGVSITFPQKRGYRSQEGGMVSADGHCRPFDIEADGTVFGSGAGVLLLKRLDDALADGDTIRAVIRGCGINNDGSGKIAFTAPSPEGQSEAIAQAYAAAEVDPASVGYIECHGTATPLGDPIEIEGLRKVFGTGGADAPRCAIGSVKGNIGHLDAAAGVAGVIKTVLALESGVIPPTAHFRQANPHLGLEDTPFFVSGKTTPWPEREDARRAGVSAFGVGGTNVHVVLEEAPPVASEVPARKEQLLVLSARSETALDAACERLAGHIERHPDVALADVASTLQIGRTRFEHRAALVCSDGEAAVRTLREGRAGGQVRGRANERPKVAFMFPGQGAQRPGMGRHLFDNEPVFRHEIERAHAALSERMDLIDVLYGNGDPAVAARRLRRTENAQPAIFAVAHALAQLLKSWDVRPDIMLGHSVGEFVAACLAGVFEFEEAIRLVALRGELMQALPEGRMLSVRSDTQTLAELLPAGAEIAAINAPKACVAAGPAEAIAALEQRLEEAGIMSRPLEASHAFHTAMVEPMIEPFMQHLAAIGPRTPTMPWISTATGDWITPEQAVDPAYWASHAHRAVCFAGAVKTAAEARPVFLELGPGAAMTSLVHAGVGRSAIAAACMPETAERHGHPLAAIARFWTAGGEPDWASIQDGARRLRVPLPTYPFERMRHFIDAPKPTIHSHNTGLDYKNADATRTNDRAGTQETPLMSVVPPPLSPSFDENAQTIRRDLLAILAQLSGQDFSGEEMDRTFLELGLDSLFLTQLTQEVQKRFAVNVTLRQLLNDVSTLPRLVEHVVRALPAPVFGIGSDAMTGGAMVPERTPATQETVIAAPRVPVDLAAMAARLEALSRQLEQHGAILQQLGPSSNGIGKHGAEPWKSRDAAGRETEPSGNGQGTVRPTDSQQELWLAAQLGRDASCAFNESLSVTLTGPLDAPVLSRAVETIVRRHESLRGRFSYDGTQFIVGDGSNIAVRRMDVSQADDPEAALNVHLAEDARTPFDLVEGPLMRVWLVRLSERLHVLVLSVHHLVCDGWSFNVVLDEVAQLYGAMREGKAPVDLAEPVSFLRYARSVNSDGARADDEAFWLSQFATLPAPLDLPTDRPRPLRRTFNGGSTTATIDEATMEAVKTAGARHGATLFTTLLTSLQILLSRLSGRMDIVVGIPAAEQSVLRESGALVGHCVNFLPLRATWDAQTRVDGLLKRNAAHVLEAFEHQRCTLGTLIRKLAVPKDPARMPLVEVEFNLDHIARNVTFEGLQTTYAPNPKRFSTFELSFNVVQEPGGLRLDCTYNTDLFAPETVAEWIELWRRVLRAMAAGDERPIGDLALFDPIDALAGRLEGPVVDLPEGTWTPDLIARQIALTPDRVAIRHDSESLTYGELGKRADAVAVALQRSGVETGHCVAVCLERSAWLPVTLLGVWKAGAAYLPLTPHHPKARRDAVLGEAEVAACVSDRKNAGDVLEGIETIVVEDALESYGGETPKVPANQSSDALAYVIYTSGSTGNPKGVEVRHRGLVNFLLSMQHEPGFAADDTLLAVTTVTFDIAALELFLPLVAGGCCHIASRRETRDGYDLLQTLEASGATMVQATPSTWRMLVEAGFVAPPGLRMLCGGEPMPGDLAAALLSGEGSLWNMYGPTETTIWSSLAPITDAGAPIGVGGPIANTTFVVLDENDALVPRGVSGQLHIGGEGVARGYRLRPDLTERAFVEIRGERLYRTGDRARILRDGSVRLAGRMDRQVKLRGFRIELGDVEAALRKAGLADCAAILREDQPGAPQIVAYYAGPSGSEMKEPDVRGALARLVPDYMIPAAFVRLDALPLGSSGKVDWRALPAPSTPPAVSRTRAASAPPAPVRALTRQAREEILARCASGVLSFPVDVDDDLFSLGVDSLSLFRIVSEARREGVTVSAADLFEKRTIAATLAGTPSGRPEERRKAQPGNIITLQGGSGRMPIFAIHNTFLFRGLAAALGPEQPFFAVPMPPELDGQAVDYTRLAARYAAIIRTVRPEGPCALIGFCFAGRLALEVAHQIREMGGEVKLIIAADAWAPQHALRLSRVGALMHLWTYRLHRAMHHLRRIHRERVRSLDQLAARSDVVRRLVVRGGNRLRTTFGQPTLTLEDEELARITRIETAGELAEIRPFEGDVLIVRSAAQPRGRFLDEALGWRAIVQGRVTVRDVPGLHENIFREGAPEFAAAVHEAIMGDERRESSNLPHRRISTLHG